MTDAQPTAATPDDANPGAQGDAGKPKVEFTAEQTAEIGRLLAKERRDAAAKAKADADAARAAADEQARKDREADDAKKRGDFEAVETRLKTDAQTAKDEATALRAENDRLRAAMKAGVDAQWGALPDVIRGPAARYLAEDDVLGRWEFLNDPETRKHADAATRDAARGNGPDPKPGGASGLPSVSDVADEFRRTRGVPVRR